MSGVFLMKDNVKIEQVQAEKIQIVVKNVNSNGILLQNAKGISLKTDEMEATEYFLEVQDAHVDAHQNQFVAIENESEEAENIDSQFVPVEMDENGQIILPDKNVILWDELCRICANTSDKVVPIFSGDGLEHNLCKKIHSYLPFKVSEDDSLPHQLCYNCAMTLLAWHEMSENCLDAQQRLLELQNTMNSKNQEQNHVSEAEEEEEEIIDNGEEMEVTSNLEDQVQVEADEKNMTETGQIIADEKNMTEIVQIIDESETDRTQQQQEQQQQREEFFMCGVCNKLYENENELMKHMRLEHREQMNYTDVRYECNTCSRKYVTKAKLVKHLQLHERSGTALRKSVYRDEEETIERSKVFDKQTHKLQFQCQDCQAILKSRRGFLRHLRVHKNERPVICEQCGKCYRIEDDLKRHLDDVHHKIKRHECDICGRCFAAKTTRDAHRRIHTQEKPFLCPECGKHFRSVNLLGIHRRIHKDLRPFKCFYCPMAFREKQKCQHHEAAIHTKNKPHQCEHCDRKFAAKGELNRHRTVHFPDHKPYVCSECPMAFRLSRYLRNHIKRYHAKDAEKMLKCLERS